MRVTVNQAELVRHLQLLSAVIDRKQTIPILSGAMLTVGDGVLGFAGTNLDNALQMWTTAGLDAVAGSAAA